MLPAPVAAGCWGEQSFYQSSKWQMMPVLGRCGPGSPLPSDLLKPVTTESPMGSCPQSQTAAKIIQQMITAQEKAGKDHSLRRFVQKGNHG